MDADALYRLRGELEEIAVDLVGTRGHTSLDRETLKDVRERLAALSAEMLEAYLDAIRERERKAAGPHGIAKCAGQIDANTQG